MIQFNLLPDVKVQFIKARRAKRTVILISLLITMASVAVLLIMFSFVSFQKKHISDLTKDIKSYQSTLQNTDDLAKILTIQNQLNSLPNLYAQRPVTSRLFKYIQSTTPQKVSITSVSLDFAASSMSISGSAANFETVNRYVDTLKFAEYTVGEDTEKVKPFSGVLLSSFSRDDNFASYSISFAFDPVIFDSSKDVKIEVPKTITTRSETELPSSGFFDSIKAEQQ